MKAFCVYISENRYCLQVTDFVKYDRALGPFSIFTVSTLELLNKMRFLNVLHYINSMHMPFKNR